MSRPHSRHPLRRSVLRPVRSRISDVAVPAALLGLIVLTVLSGSVATIAALSAPAAADPVSGCTSSTGVLVAVDFGAWPSGPQGGRVYYGCAPTTGSGPPTTGVTALQHAGFAVAGTAQYGLAFICRIGLSADSEEPTAAQQSCTSTPPGDAYWSYWHADSGANSWSYSTLGAASYDPPPGSIDAWVFGAGSEPTATPGEIRASASVPSSGTGSGSGSAGSGSAGSTGSSPGATSGPQTNGSTGGGGPKALAPGATTGGGPAPGASRSRSAGTSTGTPTTTPVSGQQSTGSATPVTTVPTIRNISSAPVSARQGGSPSAGGSPVPLLIGLAVIAVVAGTGGVVARRRRRAH